MINQLNQKIRKKGYPPMAPKNKNKNKKNFHKKILKKKLLTSHKIKKNSSIQLLISDKIISPQMLNTHHASKFFFD